MTLMAYSGARGKLIHEKNLSKISLHCTFKGSWSQITRQQISLGFLRFTPSTLDLDGSLDRGVGGGEGWDFIIQ